MCASDRVLVLIIVFFLTQVNARRWQHSTRKHTVLNTKKMSRPLVHDSSVITQDLTTKEHTTILAKVKQRLTTTTASLTVQTSTPTPKFTSINDLRKTSKLTTILLSKNPGYTKAVSTRTHETATTSTARRTAEFTTLHAVQSTSGMISKLESRPSFKKTVTVETRPAFSRAPVSTTINVQQTGIKKILGLRQTVERGTPHPFSQTHAMTTILIPKHTHAVTPIMRITTGHTTNVARRVPEFTTLHDYTLKSGLTTKLSTGYTPKPTRITTILAARRIPEQTQRRRSESTNKNILGKYHKSTGKVSLEQITRFTTTYGPRFTTKTALRHESETRSLPASRSHFEFKPMSPTRLVTNTEAEISPLPRIKTTLKETSAHIHIRTPEFTTRLTPKLNAISVQLTKTRRLNSKGAMKQTRGNTITTSYKTPKFINTLALRAKAKFSKKHSLVSKVPISRAPRYVKIHSHKELPTSTTKTLFTYSHFPILTPRSIIRSTDKQTLVFKTESTSNISSRTIHKTTEYIDTLESILTPKLTSEFAPRQTVDPIIEYEVTHPEISAISTKRFEPSRTSGFQFSQEVGITLGSEPSETTGLTAESTTVEKNVNNQLYVGVWRPWFTQDANPDQGFALGFTEGFSPGYDNARIIGIDTEIPDITQTTMGRENLIDEILKLIEELNQNITTI